MSKKLDDLTGKKFFRLLVLERSGTYVSNKGAKSVLWKCVCDCGKVKNVTSSSLKYGGTHSCGCLRSERHFNEYITDNETTYLFYKDKKIIVDTEDLEKLKPYRWIVLPNGYVQNNDKINIHRFITDCPQGKIVDHINHNKLDNRKSNLRICDYSVNGFNKRISSNTGELGISKTKKGYYVVTIDCKYIGCSKEFNTALEKRNEALKGTNQLEYNYFLKGAI